MLFLIIAQDKLQSTRTGTTTSTAQLPPVTQTITTTTTTNMTTTTTTTTTLTTTATINATVTVTPTPKVIFSDDFNSETTGAVPSKWTVSKPSDTDISIDGTVYFGASGKSVKIQDTSPTEAPIINKTITKQTGRFWYEVSIRLAQTNQIIGGVYIGNSSVSGGRYGIENLASASHSGVTEISSTTITTTISFRGKPYNHIRQTNGIRLRFLSMFPTKDLTSILTMC